MAASIMRPMCAIVENNQYAYSTPLSQQMKVPDIALRAAGYGIPGVTVDGNDVEAVYRVTERGGGAGRAAGAGRP